jgi:hypothetical protein
VLLTFVVSAMVAGAFYAAWWTWWGDPWTEDWCPATDEVCPNRPVLPGGDTPAVP